MAKLARVMFLLLCHVTSIAKQLVFYLDADAIDRLVAHLDGLHDSAHISRLDWACLELIHCLQSRASTLAVREVYWRRVRRSGRGGWCSRTRDAQW